MKQGIKKAIPILFIFTIVCISLVIFGVNSTSIVADAAVDDLFTIDNIIYQVLTEEENNYTVEVSGNTLTQITDVVIPSTVTNGDYTYTVTEIGGMLEDSESDNAFHDCNYLRSIELPNTITQIGVSAFDNCGLTEIDIPDSVVNIRGYAFRESSLQRITLSDNLEYLGVEAFDSCRSLKEIEIPSKITAINSDTFYGCWALESVKLPDGLLKIGIRAFSQCSSLADINIPEGVKFDGMFPFNGCTALEEITLPSSITWLPQGAFMGCTSLKNITMPGVNSMDLQAFKNCSALETITFNSGLTTIPQEAYYGCTGLTEVIIPATVTKIEVGAFAECTNLDYITVYGADVTYKSGTRAFPANTTVYAYANSTTVDYCEDYSITCYSSAPYSVEYCLQNIGSEGYSAVEEDTETLSAFPYETTEAVANNTYDGYTMQAFEQQVVSPKRNTVVKIYYDLDPLEVGDTFTYQNIVYKVLTNEENNYTVEVSGNALTASTSVVIPGSIQYDEITYSVKAIGAYAFQDCTYLTNIELSQGITTIDDFAFFGANSFRNLDIPSSVTTIGNGAFRKTGIAEITIPATVQSMGTNLFRQNDYLISAYIYAPITELGDCAFSECTYLNNVKLPDTLTTVNYQAFNQCSRLSSINLHQGITTIGQMAFRLCTSLTELVIPSTVTSIGSSILSGCSALTDVTIYAKTTVVDGSFSNCTALEKVKAYYSTGVSSQVSSSVYVPIYDLAFDANGGEKNASLTELESTIWEKDQSITFEDTHKATQATYDFGGWLYNGSTLNTGDQFTFNGETDVITFTAQWTRCAVESVTIPTEKLVQWYAPSEEFIPFDVSVLYSDGNSEIITIEASALTGFSTEETTPSGESCTATFTTAGEELSFTYYVRDKVNMKYVTESEEIDLVGYVGQQIYLMDNEGYDKTGYNFKGWVHSLTDATYIDGGSYTFTADDDGEIFVMTYELKYPTYTSTHGEELTFTYDGVARNVTVTGEHELSEGVEYTYKWYQLDTSIPPWLAYTYDFDNNATLVNESSTYAFVDCSQGLNGNDGYYYWVVISATYGGETKKCYYNIKVTINKATPDITVSKPSLQYMGGDIVINEELTITTTGESDTNVSAVSNLSGVAFEYSDGVISNVTQAGGTFTLTVTQEESNNYLSYSEDFEIELHKGVQTLTVEETPFVSSFAEEYAINVIQSSGELSYALLQGDATIDGNVITANSAGSVQYSVTASETAVYNAITKSYWVYFDKKAGNLAPDYSVPTGLTICIDHSSQQDVTLPSNWAFSENVYFDEARDYTVLAVFTPADTNNYHTYQVGITVTATAHVAGDEATCTEAQHCTVCNRVLVNALNHDFNTPYVSMGESGHAHKCANCDVYDTTVPHSSVDEATCTSAKLCDACDYEMEAQKDHSFTEQIEDEAHLKEEGTDCVTGATYWYDCATCAMISTEDYWTADAQGNHNFDEDGFCTLCDGVEAPYYNENRDINGDGTPDGAYEVSKVGHLYWFPSDYGEYIDGNVFLMNDIVVNENVLLEDGSLNASAVESFRIWKSFFGLGEDYVFDGNGKFISGLYLIDYGSGFGVGGLLGENHGIIKNLTVKNSYLEGYEFGSIVYYNGGIVENCHSVNNTLVSKYGGGGVVGINYGNGTIKDCTNSSNLYVENGLDDETIMIFLGGIVAKNEGGVIKNCVNYGTITATANSSEYINVGGIIGGNNYDGTEGIVETTNCHNKGNIIVQSMLPAVGGVVGFGVYNRISDCTNTGNITVDANYDEAVGGIVGASSFSVTIERCYNAGDIEINAGSFGYSVAGIAGWTMTTTIVNSYNVGNIEVTFDENFDENNAGRMATSGIANIDTSLVCNCYNAGEIIIPAEYQSTLIYGGVIVLDDNDTSSLVENNYYLNATANEHGGRTAEQFASGEVAYALCKQIVIDEEFTIDGSAWGQTIGTDLTPVFDGDKVYAISHCANNATLYANDQSAVYVLTKTDAKESTCQVQGNNAYWTCSICNKVYADENCTIVTSVEDSKLDLADHDWSATWDYEDEDGHAHKCLTPGCNEISTIEDHVEGAPATEDDPQLCTECGYVITPATGHVNHVSSGEYGYDENSHWFKCTGCDTYKIDQTAHQFDNACDVDCACGYVRTVTHQYTVLNKDATHHWYECSVCNEVEQGSKVAHSGGSATCEDKAVCSICSTEYGNLGSHNYDRSEWGYIAEDGHGYVCVWCEEVEEVITHTPNIPSATEESAQYCTACQYQMAAQLNHTHSPATEWTSNATHHWKACRGCNEHLEEAPHSYDPNNACDTTCEVCNAVREVAHSFTGEWEKDASGHWHVCTKNGCSVTDTKQNHVSAGAATETDPEVCSICGWQIAPALGHTTHTPEAEWQKNETHHWHECTGCDGQELDKAVHNDGNNDGSCDACGYAMSVTPPSHTHAHGSTWVTDANEHWNECECGDKANKAAHVDDNGDNKCDTCDCTMPAHDPDPQPPVDNSPTDDNDGLGTGAIIGIVVAAVAVVGGGGFAIFWFVIRKKRR